MSESQTALLYDERFLDHQTGPKHPECPERLTAVWGRLSGKLAPLGVRHLRPALADESWLAAVHSTEYIRRAREACASGAKILDTPDVRISAGSYEAALLACGGAMDLADAVMSGVSRNGFALLRPPGHHAEEKFAMGFCLFNNVAIAARYLQKRHGLERILILDWDVHHGNGTQHLFEEDPSVFYVSIHEYPFYPGTGAYWETGVGRGEGATLNCPVRAGAGDAEYREIFLKQIEPAVDRFRPDAILISAGFDAHERDPLGHVRLSTDMFGWMTDRVMDWASRHAHGRVLSLLEGGYDWRALADCVELHVSRLSGKAQVLSEAQNQAK